MLDSPRMTLKAMLEIMRCPSHLELHVHAVHTNAKPVTAAAAAPIWLPPWVGASGSASGSHAHPAADTLTAKGAFLELVALLDRLASQCDVFRIVIHSRSLADGLQKHLRVHGYHEVEFGGFGILRLEKICRHPKVDRLVVCLAAESHLQKTQQWYAAVLGLQMRPETSAGSPSSTAAAADGSLVLPDLRSTPVHVAWIAADGTSAFVAGNPPSLPRGGDAASGAAKLLSSPLLAIHIETPDLLSWKQHLQLTQVKYSEESDAALTALHDATDVSYAAGLCFRDPAGLRIRVLQPAAADERI